jgi:hypothetical protein
MKSQSKEREEHVIAEYSERCNIAKVARFLLNYKHKASYGTEPITISRMAVLTGISPHSANESLISLQAIGVLKLSRGVIVIVDKYRMQDLMDTSYCRSSNSDNVYHNSLKV